MRATPHPIPADLAALLFRRILPTLSYPPSGCWLRTSYVSCYGYGIYSRTHEGRRRNYLVHRISYVYHNGAIPEGLEIDHLCRVRNCCNPAHLEAVTHEENLRRAHLREFCHRGHRKGAGVRSCPECHRIKATARRGAGLAPDDPRHGTENGYLNLGCRCLDCLNARRAARLRRSA